MKEWWPPPTRSRPRTPAPGPTSVIMTHRTYGPGPGPGRLSIRFCTYFLRWRLSDEPNPPAPHVIVAVLTQGPLAIANSGRNFFKLPSLYRHTWILLDMPSYLRLTLLLAKASQVLEKVVPQRPTTPWQGSNLWCWSGTKTVCWLLLCST